jgi:hypothetical protein
MAEVPVPGHQVFWEEKRTSLQAEYPALIKKHPDADAQYRQLFSVLCNIEDVASYTPNAVGNSVEWQAVVSNAERTGLTTAKPSHKKHFSVHCMALTPSPYGT